MHNQDKKLNLLIQKIAAPKTIIILLIAFIFVMVIVNLVFKQTFNYLTQTFNYTPQYAYQLLTEIGSNGRNNHLLVLFFDIILVLLYSVLLVGANNAIFNKFIKSCFGISFITFSPLILSVIQLVEIAILSIVLLNYPNQLFPLVEIINIVTIIKILLTFVFFLLPLVGLCVSGIRKLFVKQV